MNKPELLELVKGYNIHGLTVSDDSHTVAQLEAIVASIETLSENAVSEATETALAKVEELTKDLNKLKNAQEKAPGKVTFESGEQLYIVNYGVSVRDKDGKVTLYSKEDIASDKAVQDQLIKNGSGAISKLK